MIVKGALSEAVNAKWGNIPGNIEDQEDLMALFDDSDEKQSSLIYIEAGERKQADLEEALARHNEIEDEKARAVKRENEIEAKIGSSSGLEEEIKRAKSAEASLDKKIADETTRAKNEEISLKYKIDDEITRSKNEDSNLNTNIEAERLERQRDDNELDGKISSEADKRRENDNFLRKLIEDEAGGREQADVELRSAINTERDYRISDDKTLQSNIDNEAVIRGNADDLLQAADEQEKNERTSNDNRIEAKLDEKSEALTKDIINLQEGLVNINSKMSDKATSDNKLVDKKYVDDLVESQASRYLTKNAKGDNFDRLAELKAATEFYTGGIITEPTIRDYVIVAKDEDHNDKQARYIITSFAVGKPVFSFQYVIDVNFTDAERAALDSGITKTKREAYDAHLFNVDNPHSVTKNQIGLGNVDNTSDANKPVSTLQQAALDAEITRATGKEAELQTSLTNEIEARKEADFKKQDKLTAGENITIVDNVISATGGGGGGEPLEYLKRVSISGNKATFVNKDNSTNVYNPSIPSKTSDLVNDSGFLTEHQSLDNYRKSTDQDVIDNSIRNRLDTIEGKEAGWDAKSVVSGTAEGDNWSKISINGTEHSIPQGGGGEPNEYLKKVTISGNKATFVEKTGRTVDYNPDIPTKTSQLTNDSGFLTSHQSLAEYRKSADQDAIDTWLGNRITTIEGKEEEWDKKSTVTVSNTGTSTEEAKYIKVETKGVEKEYKLAGSDLFLVTYNTTTYEEITAALNNGKLPVCYNDFKLYVYSKLYSNTYIFSAADVSDDVPSIKQLKCDSANTWTSASLDVQNKLTAGEGINITDNVISSTVGTREIYIQQGTTPTPPTEMKDGDILICYE